MLISASSAELSEPLSQTRSRRSDSPSIFRITLSTSVSAFGCGTVPLPHLCAVVIDLYRYRGNWLWLPPLNLYAGSWHTAQCSTGSSNEEVRALGSPRLERAVSSTPRR